MSIRTITAVTAAFVSVSVVFSSAVTYSGANNRIEQRTIVSNGFTFADEKTTCTTQSVYPISGPISINNGTLRLAEDTTLSSGATIQTGGRIEGDGNQLSITRRAAPIELPENSSYAGVINAYVKKFGYRIGAFGCAQKHHGLGTVCAGVAYGEAATTLDVYTMVNGSFTPRASVKVGGGSRCLAWSPHAYDGLCGVQGQPVLMGFSLDDSLNKIHARNYSFEQLTSEVAAIGWHPSGEYALISQARDGAPLLLLKRTADGFDLHASYTIPGIVNTISSIAWSPDGTMCAIGSISSAQAHELFFFSVDDTSQLSFMQSYNLGGHVSWISWRPTGKECWIALVGSNLDSYLRSVAWHGDDREPDMKKYAITNSVYDVVWNKDGNLLALTTEFDELRGEVGVYQLRGERLERANAKVYESRQFMACWATQENIVCTVDNLGNLMMSEVAAGMQLDNITIAPQSSLVLTAANCIERDVAFAGGGVIISAKVPDPFYLKEDATLVFHDCTFTTSHEQTVIEAMPHASVIVNNGALLPAKKLTSHAQLTLSGHCQISGEIDVPLLVIAPHSVIELVGDVVLQGEISCQGSATIIGNGYRCDMKKAALNIAPETTVAVTHLGSLALADSSLQCGAASSELVVSQSLLELEHDIVLLSGVVRFDGMSSVMIGDALYTPSRGSFIADGAHSYASFCGAPQVTVGSSRLSNVFTISEGTHFLSRDTVLSSSLQWKITRDVVIDGRGYDLRMGPGKKSVITIEPGATVTFTNISLSQFDPSRIAIKGASRYQFNNNVHISLSGGISSDFTCVAHGCVTIDGMGYGVSDAVSFVVMSHSQLHLKRINFNALHQGSIRMRDETSSLLLSNVQCHLSESISLSHGSYSVYDAVSISGKHTLTYASTGYLTVNKAATFSFEDGAEFHFCPEVNSDVCPLRMLDPLSVLQFNNASCRVDKTRLLAQKGRLHLRGSVLLNGGGLGFVWGDENHTHMSSITYDPNLDLTVSGLVVCNNGA